MRKHRIKAPLLDWQISADELKDGGAVLHSKMEELGRAVVQLSKGAMLYHVDGEVEGEEHLHFRFVMCDVQLFKALAKSYGLKNEGKDIDDIMNH